MTTDIAETPTRRRDERAIVPPASFPVRWPHPDDARMYWELDLMHYPAPMATLEFELMALYPHGFNVAMEQYGVPVRMRALQVNYYNYQSIYPIAAPPDAVLRLLNGIGKVLPGFASSIQRKAVDAQTRKYLPTLEAATDNLGTLWDGEWLPEIKEHLTFWNRFDLTGASTQALVRHFDESVERSLRVGVVHFLLGIPQLYAVSRYQDVYNDLFPGDHPLEAFTLLQGFDNKTLETNRELWRLSGVAAADPEVRAAILANEPADAMQAIAALPGGAPFLAALRAYLEKYGQRGDRFSTIGEVSWVEDPAPVIKNLKDYLLQPVGDPDDERRTHAVARDRAVTAARERLKGYPAPVTTQFERALAAAQIATVLQEDHGFWIDYRCLHALRRVVLEFGRRFTASGVLDAPNDALFLSSDELRETAAALPAIDRRALVAARRAERDRFAAMKAPRALGRIPLMAPPESDPVARTITRFFGPPTAAAPEADGRTIKGIAGSTGVYRGTARVIGSLSEASRLAHGEILVTETTAAPWTPLFATAGAVVTNTGGVLSHCALVAREYRIPAVIGTGNATTRIADGAQIEVDGSTGRVTLL